MQFETISEAKNYLSNLDTIIVPSEYTYFVHFAGFDLPEEATKNKYNKAWTALPTEGFTVRNEMSFVERRQRISEALDYGGLNRAMTSYSINKSSKPFQIRVIMPRLKLTEEENKKLGLSQEDLLLLSREYHGLGNGRHPKLKDGEIIKIFATSIVDEVTRTQEDIFYGIRQQDLIPYARIVNENLALNGVVTDILPTNKNSYYSWNDKKTFSLPKNKNKNRYQGRKVRSQYNGNYQYEYSEFEREYLNGLTQKQTIDKELEL